MLNFCVHLFHDTSKHVYAAAIFFRTETQNGVHIQAKCCIATMKALTISKMELLAAAIGARLLHNILNELSSENTSIHCWTDSTIALSWIKRREKGKQFVWNRVVELQELTRKE